MTTFKTYLPYVILAALVVLGAYLLITDRAVAPIEEEAVETEIPQEEEETVNKESKAPTSGGIGVSLPEGVNIVKQTTWKPFTNEAWELSFKYQSGWRLSTVNDDKGVLLLASLNAGDFTILVQKDKPIAHPALVSATTYTRAIAGQEVEVTEYEKPNETYAYYLYFMLTDGNDDFYVTVRSKIEERKDVEGFLERLLME